LFSHKFIKEVTELISFAGLVGVYLHDWQKGSGSL
jgi:hypothetical protein